MAENVDNLVLEQLPLIRQDIAKTEDTLGDKIDGLEAKVDGNTGILVALGRCIHSVGGRVEHIEENWG